MFLFPDDGAESALLRCLQGKIIRMDMSLVLLDCWKYNTLYSTQILDIQRGITLNYK